MKMENVERSLLVRVPDDGHLSSEKHNAPFVKYLSNINFQMIYLVPAACDEQVALLFLPVPPDGSYPIRVLFRFE